MKKYLFIALAALGFAACAEKVDDTNIPKGELEESYIAINLMAADVDTRAVTDDIGNADEYGYEEGTDAERAVNTAYFFFFDENGNPFNVYSTNQGANAPGGATNYLSLALGTHSEPEQDEINISDIYNSVLVLNTYKGIYPSQLVAVLNWIPTKPTYSLDELHNEIYTELTNSENHFVMSNSVYMNSASKLVDAVEITEGDIKETPDDAMKNPLEIYVERTAARISIDLKNTNQDKYYKVTDENLVFKPMGKESRDVYVAIYGWELYNEFTTTNILKNVQNWDPTSLGLTWNDMAFYRSYWAKTEDRTLQDEFSWQYARPSDNGVPYTFGYQIVSPIYCGENTLDWRTKDTRTKIILKGQLHELVNGDNGNPAYKPLELARWYGNDYAGTDDLKTAVANSLAYTLFYKVENGYSSIKADDIEIVHGNKIPDAKAYEVGFQLTTDAQTKEWYKYSSDNKHVILGTPSVVGDNAAQTNAELAKVEPAVWYQSGQTYYIVDIKHLGQANKPAEYGIVRNHCYYIDINSITGYGSPGYNGVSFLVPEYPATVEDSYVAAKINVLSWKVVKQDVDIETK